jgi:hypothetical protein
MPHQACEALCALASQQAVRRRGNVTRDQHRISDPAQQRNGPEPAPAVHNARIHFNCAAVKAQHGTGAGVEAAIVFHRYHSSYCGAERGAIVELTLRRLCRGKAAIIKFASRASAAMNNDRPSCCTILHLDSQQNSWIDYAKITAISVIDIRACACQSFPTGLTMGKNVGEKKPGRDSGRAF